MRSIPTDLLRAFITIIDLRGYTRAGERLGRSQPAISLQMKRLQDLLNVQLFDKDANGARLTEAGELVAGYARRILALNDEMLLKLSKRDTRGKLRLGIPNDYADHFLPKVMERFTEDLDGLQLDVVCDVSHELLNGLRDGLFDIVIAMTPDGPAEGAFMTWREPLVWAGPGPIKVAQRERSSEQLRIVCYPEGCLYRRAMLTALQREGKGFEIVYTTPSISGIEAAVKTGFGITVLAERILPKSLVALPTSLELPRIADVVVGVYVTDYNVRSQSAQNFAAQIADIFMDEKTYPA